MIQNGSTGYLVTHALGKC